MKRIVYLYDKASSMSDEECAGWEFLKGLKNYQIKKVSFQEIVRNPSVLDLFNVLWWHFDDSIYLPAIVNNELTLRTIRTFIKKGGGLLLTLFAAQYVKILGFETNEPNVIAREQKSDLKNQAFNAKYGFCSYLGHPIFKGFGKNLYTYSLNDKEIPVTYYSKGHKPKEGKVVAVEHSYIRLNEDNKIILEYNSSNGRVLTIGAFVYLSLKTNQYKEHLEVFLENCFDYLSTLQKKINRSVKTYWYDFLSETSTPIINRIYKIPKFQFSLREPLICMSGGINQDKRYYDISGRRVFVTGMEGKGISEVWCSPVRILRNIRFGVKNISKEIIWNDALYQTCVAAPEFFKSFYKTNNVSIEETIFCSLKKPCGGILFFFEIEKKCRIIIKGSIDLRYMWPYSEKATGSLKSHFSKESGVLIVNSLNDKFVSIIGSSLSPNEIKIEPENIIDEQPYDIKFSWDYELTPGKHSLFIPFAGGDQGLKDAEEAYQDIIQNPQIEYLEQYYHTKHILQKSLSLETPDTTFNESFKWAKIGLKKLLFETPNVGESLFAGIGTTEKGWNGGHKINGRPGYAWYFGRDSIWCAFALLSLGEFGAVRNILDFLGRHQDLTGKILHEFSTSGVIHYDAADSTPLYIVLMGRYLATSNDLAFVKKEYSRILNVMRFCLSTDSDKDSLIENTNVGHGWVEGGKLHPVHSELYLIAIWKSALENAAFIESKFGNKKRAHLWYNSAKEIEKIIEKKFWNKETSFYNFGLRKDKTYITEKTIFPTVAMYLCKLRKDRIEKSVEELSSSKYSTDWGVRAVSCESPDYDPTGYHQGSVWPLFTGWTALAEYMNGFPLQGCKHLMSNINLYNCWSFGFTEEVLHGDRFEPSGVCSHQGWSESIIISSIIEGMIGLQNDIQSKKLNLKPSLPFHWNEVNINNIRFGKCSLNIRIKKQMNLCKIIVSSNKRVRISLNLDRLLPPFTELREFYLNGRRRLISEESKDGNIFDIHNKSEITMKYYEGIGIIPHIPIIKPSATSVELRLISQKVMAKSIRLDIEGISGKTYELLVLDRNDRIENVVNCVIVRKNEDFKTLSVTFPDNFGRIVYVPMEIQLYIKKNRK